MGAVPDTDDASPTFDRAPELLRLTVGGMTCATCAGRVERVLARQPGVLSARVNLASERASVALAPEAAADEDALRRLGEAVARAGFSIERAPSSAAERAERRAGEHREARRELALLLGAAALTAPLVLPMVLMPLGIHWMPPGPVQLALALPVQVVGGARFYRGAWTALADRTANMDVLVALGTSAAFLLSIVALARGGALYFESSATVITLVLLGKFFERRARHSTTRAIEALVELQPETARVERGGELVELPVEALSPGAVVVVRPGERIAVDGEVLEGRSSVDESLLTGESMPVDKGPGSPVTGGAINGEGRLRIETTRVGDDTALARIIALVDGAQASRAPIQRAVDRVAAVFVPAVLGLAGITLLAWWLSGAAPVSTALIYAVSVLVIACPCALGLATPTALMVGTGAAARAGILIRDAEVLERARNVDTVVFDKTGTLTEGRPELRRLVAVGGSDPARLLALAAAVQAGSEHPLAGAVRREAKRRGLRPAAASEVRAHPGHGVSGTVDGAVVRIGSPRWRRVALANSAGAEQSSRELAEAEAEGTVMLVTREAEGDGELLLGWLAVHDPMRGGSAPAVAALRAAGVRTVMISGDNQRTAEAVAGALGIDELFAEVLPEQKADHVRRLREGGAVVAMVGDGVNDAPALAVADVGFAMSTGADVAVHTAGVTLMRAEPRLVFDAIDISRATHRKIWQNLFWAFVFNGLGLPLAAAGMLSPMLAGGAMALSSVTVVSNALLLRRWRPAAGQAVTAANAPAPGAETC